MKVVLVTGSRDCGDGQRVWSVLDMHKPDLLVHGACPTGADDFADKWCDATGTTCIPMPAPWDGFGKRAGPLRNRAMCHLVALMAEHGHTAVVCAFPMPGSKGTRNCIKEAEALSLKVEVCG